MSDTDNKDKDLENYLKGSSNISSLYQETLISDPSPETDAAILAAARRAVDSKPKPVSPFGYRWMVPTSLAAVLVLTVSIVILQPQSPETTGETDTILEGNERFDLSEQRARKKEKQDKNQSAIVNRQLGKSANVEQLQDGRSSLEQEEASGKLTEQQAKPAVKKEQIATAPQPAMEPQPAPAVSGSMVQAESAPVDSGITSTQETKTIIADSGQKQRTEADDMKSADVGSRFSSAATMAPEKWLDKIQKLLVEKKTDEATREFKLFKKTFPDYQIDYSRYKKLKEIDDSITQ